MFSEHQLKIAKVAEWRKKDAEKNYKGQDFAMKLSQDHQGLSQDDLHPKPKKKRGRGKESEDDEYVPPPQIQHYCTVCLLQACTLTLKCFVLGIYYPSTDFESIVDPRKTLARITAPSK